MTILIRKYHKYRFNKSVEKVPEESGLYVRVHIRKIRSRSK